MSKVYVLTDCAAEENYTPRVFSNKEDAIKALREQYDEYTQEEDYVCSSELDNNHAEIIYVDDTYNVLDIFEVEVEV